MVKKLYRPHVILAAVLLFELIGLIVSWPLHLMKFDWPADVEEMLFNRAHLLPDEHYTDEQADEFMANAMVLHAKAAHEASAKVAASTRRQRALGPLLRSAGLWPKHVVGTEGYEQETPRSFVTQFWFSLPLLDQHPYFPGGKVYHHVQLENGESVRSLDLLRFDRFSPRGRDGLWLPSAIVRPEIGKDKSLLRFKVVYELPTSVVQYRTNFRIHPKYAADSMRRALEAKQAIWLRKLDPMDAEVISHVWGSAPGSPLLPRSGFFTPKERREALIAIQTARLRVWKPSELVQPDVITVSSSSSETTKPIMLQTSSPADEQMTDTASTSAPSTSMQVLPHPPVEHDFFSMREPGLNQPIRPKSLYPWQATPPGFRPSYLQALDKEHEMDLDLSLAPSSSSGSPGSSSTH